MSNGSLFSVHHSLPYQCFLTTKHNAAKHANPPPANMPAATPQNFPHAHPSGHGYPKLDTPRPTHQWER